jgi:hypothetical protein
MHLSDVELVDLADGTRPETSAPHLATCEPCRRQLVDMRRMMSAAAAVDVPEPSPLFWEHFSDRVRDMVAAEAHAPRAWWRGLLPMKQVLIPSSAYALIALLVAGVVTSRGPRVPLTEITGPTQPEGFGAAENRDADLFEDAALEDESLTLMADLSAAIGVDVATDVVLAPRVGAEHAVTNLNDDELRELERLLNELGASGA